MDIPIVNWPRENVVDKVHIDAQEYSFAGILKQGPLVSCLDTTTYQKVQDTSSKDNTSLVFSMNVLDSSKIVMNHTEFEGRGLSGWWKVIRQDPHQLKGRPPRIQLQEFVPIETMDDLKKLLLHPSSANFVRSRQDCLLTDL